MCYFFFHVLVPSAHSSLVMDTLDTTLERKRKAKRTHLTVSKKCKRYRCRRSSCGTPTVPDFSESSDSDVCVNSLSDTLGTSLSSDVSITKRLENFAPTRDQK